MASTTRNRPAFPPYRSLRTRALLVGIVGISGLIAFPAVSEAASRAAVATQGHQLVARATRPRSSSVCSAVSAASVSAIVGYSVPAGTPGTYKIAASKTNDEISGVVTSCTFGAETNLAALEKDVTLEVEVTSKSMTSSEMQKAIALADKTSGIKITPYSGLGVPGFYFSLTDGGITGQGITGVVGTRSFGASLETKTLSMSKLATLAKLADKL